MRTTKVGLFLTEFYTALTSKDLTLPKFFSSRQRRVRRKEFATPPQLVLDTIAGYEQDTTMRAVLNRLDTLEDHMTKHRDGRRYFVRAYRHMTEAIRRAVESEGQPLFEDPAWVASFDVSFARVYFERLKNYYDPQALAPEPLPQCWRQAFAVARDSRLPFLPVFMMMASGINAHLLYDVPFALAQSGVFGMTDEVQAAHKRDFMRINQLVKRKINPIKRIVLQSKSARRLKLMDGVEALQEIFNFVTFSGFVQQRYLAWVRGQHLAEGLLSYEQLDKCACTNLDSLKTIKGMVKLAFEAILYYFFLETMALMTATPSSIIQTPLLN